MAAKKLLDHLDRAEHGRLKLQFLIDSTFQGEGGGQFIHRFVSTGKYTCQHEREGCQFCDLVDEIWGVLNDYTALVRGWLDTAEAAAQDAARAQAEREYGQRVERETTEYLLSQPEFERA